MYDIILLHERSMEKQEMILKFFYLIDPDQIIKGLSGNLIPKDNDDTEAIDNLFHIIFEKIYRASALYNQYLDPTYNSHESFFGEPGCTSNSGIDYRAYWARLEHIRTFLKLSLRNHCITQGFFNSLAEKIQTNMCSYPGKMKDFFSPDILQILNVKKKVLRKWILAIPFIKNTILNLTH